MTTTQTTIIAGLILLMMSSCAQPGVANPGKSEGKSSRLVDTLWTVKQLGDETGATIQTLSLTFVSPDRVNGHDGCNAFSARVTMTDSTIRIGDKLLGTMAACPEDVEARARTYHALLLKINRYQLYDVILELMDATGKTLITLTPTSQSLAGISWQAISYHNGRQAVVSLIVGTKISAKFGEDGRITGHAGCNAYFAAYQVSGQTIVIHSPGATRRACAEPAGVMEQETQYLQALAMATRYQMSGIRLELRNPQGSLMAVFARGGG
jgi:heat shock protein HslJ